MKKLYSIIVTLFLGFFGMQAQEMSVQSFVLAETDLTANTPGTMVYDQNGNVCALIKVETSHDGFTFDVGSLGVSDVKRVGGEIWVYVPFGVRRITVSHQQLGVIRDYQFPCAIEKGRTYIMKLIAGNVRTIVEHVPTRQFLYIELDPAEAALEINGELKITDKGVYQELLPYGLYNYKVYYSGYHDLTGIVEVSERKQSLSLKLKSAFGSLSVLDNSRHDYAGASVYVDDRLEGTIPLKDIRLNSGSHRIRIMKELYKPYSQEIMISDDEHMDLVPDMVTNYAEVTLSTGSGAGIYVNNELKGKGTWTGRLITGSYIFESRQDGHIPFKMSYDITPADHRRTIMIQSPTPTYGSLVISSDPPKGKVYVDDEYAGDTPLYIPNLLVGEHKVMVKWTNAYSLETVNVIEGVEIPMKVVASESSVLSEVEESQRNKALKEAVQGASDETVIKFDDAGYKGAFAKKMKEAEVSDKDFVLTLKGVEYPMVFVEGGSFMMGADDSDAESNEKPVHKVTLSSYSIGKYEVTQELWEAVMGSNPSYSIGPSKPVEKVSWNDCQEFIGKLNALTGMNFKLPTEAQWEFAARGGNKSRGYKYSGSNTIGNVSWYGKNGVGKTHKVGTKAPNELGIYDMSGNVWEWCGDWDGSYSSSSQTDPTGPANGSYRVIRGGCWFGNARGSRVSYRYYHWPDNSFNALGFRLCL